MVLTPPRIASFAVILLLAAAYFWVRRTRLHELRDDLATQIAKRNAILPGLVKPGKYDRPEISGVLMGLLTGGLMFFVGEGALELVGVSQSRLSLFAVVIGIVCAPIGGYWGKRWEEHAEAVGAYWSLKPTWTAKQKNRLPAFLVTANSRKKSGAVIATCRGEICLMYLRKGQLYHAEISGLVGEAAAIYALGWEGDALVTFDAKSTRKPDTTIAASLEELLILARKARRAQRHTA